ncbi:DSD1 family PLP-dependent enzyme [Caballeronia sp. LZ065]|uniref:DSD1 family PLP-dependent enzyme n=1 Tax=Caballeronia sp. LZ065 TaxID=3038571 RepID=UPI002860FB6A|nr:DSD1 family PLP-dependent enzyme [Caballeronia sp. LZ065]MDR5782294.1 DSD1 family PLP-dependent enzyme [Caballeronia sp. LZ065]
MQLAQLDTPAAIIDIARMQRNIAAMQSRMDALGVKFRPHVKTTKCLDVVRAQIAAGARGITVSTLKEAEQFFSAGITDILYAVGIAPAKLPRAFALRQRGCELKIIADNVAAARAIGDYCNAEGASFEVWLEIDTDGHRSGLAPEDDALIDIGRILQEGGIGVGGVLTHAGSSYELNQPNALAALAAQERDGCVRAAERLREAGIACRTVSIGSTPTALAATHLEGIDEVRAGVYVFFDLVMANVGACTTDEIALSVLASVIGHQPDKGWVIVDAGWMAMSRDRGTSKQTRDFGYGLACALDGTPLPGCEVIGANQEHGIIAVASADDLTRRFPIGMKLRILPNHACATGAQYPEYHALSSDGSTAVWPRFHGW